MKIISMINYKGGVGKTTLTANLAAELSKRDYKVLLIDLDPQCSLTFSFMSVDVWKDNYQKRKTIKKFLDDFIYETNEYMLSDVIIPLNKINTRITNLDLICSHLGLINIDIDLALKLTGTPKQYKRNFVKVMSIIKNDLELLYNDYDFVLIDCPPNFNIITKNALVASNYFIVPTKLDYLSTIGVPNLNLHIDHLIKEYNYNLKHAKTGYPSIAPSLLGIVGNMVGTYNKELITVNKQYLDVLKAGNYPIFETFIKESKTLFSDNSAYGVPIVLQDGERFKDIRTELELFTGEVLKKVGII